MYELNVQGEFCAAHALSIAGVREPVHGHNWRVTVTITGETLDRDGLLCDFHTVEQALHEVIDPFHNADLNQCEAFRALNPSAEHVARHIARELARRLDPPLQGSAWVSAVAVTEAPGCLAVFRTKGPRHP